MKTRTTQKNIIVATAFLLAVLLLHGCSGGGAPKPTPTATPPVSVGDSSFGDGRALDLSFKLLYALDSYGGDSMLDTAGIIQCMAAIKNGASGDTDTELAEALGMQDMMPKQINEIALGMRQAVDKLQKGRFSTAWGLFVGEQQAVKERYLMECEQALKLKAVFQQLDSQNGNKYLGEWADENTGGRIKNVKFPIPAKGSPFFVDLLLADPDWQLALDTGKSRPLPFHFENGDEKAVPTMVCVEKCGVYSGPDGSMAILPTSGDETRLIIMMPPAQLGLNDFIPVAAGKHDEWLEGADWKTQRVLLPRFQLSYQGSVAKVLVKAGLPLLFSKDGDYSTLGDGLHFSDILQKSSLIVDESGVDSPDPNAVYRQGVKDDMNTLAIDRPFLVALEKTDTGQILMMGFVRDPLNAATQ